MPWNLLLIKVLDNFWYFKHQILTRIVYYPSANFTNFWPLPPLKNANIWNEWSLTKVILLHKGAFCVIVIRSDFMTYLIGFSKLDLFYFKIDSSFHLKKQLCLHLKLLSILLSFSKSICSYTIDIQFLVKIFLNLLLFDHVQHDAVVIICPWPLVNWICQKLGASATSGTHGSAIPGNTYLVAQNTKISISSV